MKAIIIENKDAIALLDKLELERIKASKNVVSIMGDSVDDAHRIFHYHVVTWLQDHGASCIR